MASACVNNINMAQAYSWLDPSSEAPDSDDFEFRLEDPIAMLSADELFSGGKLVPLHVTKIKQESVAASSGDERKADEAEMCRSDSSVLSPKQPRCSSRLKDILRLKKIQNRNSKAESHVPGSLNENPKILRYFSNRSARYASDQAMAMNLPLLKESDCDSRLSFSSSSSGTEVEDLARLSLDSEKPRQNLNLFRHPNPFVHAKMRAVKPKSDNAETGGDVNSAVIGVSADSPRMNSSGKVVFHGLERSSSSPGSFNAAAKSKHRRMERSYSANVRVTPVLNVAPWRGSSRSGYVLGLGQLFSSSIGRRTGGSRVPQSNIRSRSEGTS